MAQEIAAEVSELLQRLQFDKEPAMHWWNKHQERHYLVLSAEHTFRTRSADDLMSIPADQLEVIEQFYGALEAWELFCKYTQAMPGTVGSEWDAARERLVPLGERVIECVGPVPPFPEPPGVKPRPTFATLKRPA